MPATVHVAFQVFLATQVLFGLWTPWPVLVLPGLAGGMLLVVRGWEELLLFLLALRALRVLGNEEVLLLMLASGLYPLAGVMALVGSVVGAGAVVLLRYRSLSRWVAWWKERLRVHGIVPSRWEMRFLGESLQPVLALTLLGGTWMTL